ncbi:ligand-binding sensor domain-containing protein [Glaciecola sp. 1036]|uniref:ligand-binding sensor domain-containing protein n=1 Tax=Alteromonadaceae TaxID=72275 RepID=UPI003CFF5837
MSYRTNLLIVACLLLFSSALFAAADNVRFERLGLKEGISQKSITTIFQDSKGFLWFGTQEGLNRYDGYKFKSYMYDPNDNESLSNVWVMSINEDLSGNIWVGTRGGLSILNVETSKFRRYSSGEGATFISHPEVNEISRDDEGNMWVITEGGIDKYNPVTSTFIHYKEYTYEENGESKTIQLSPYSSVTDRSGRKWFGLPGGIFVLDPITGSIRKIPVVFHGKERSNLKATSILIDSNNRLWLGAGKMGVLYADLNTVNFNGLPEKLEFYTAKDFPNAIVNHMYQDNNGVIWFATDSGLAFLTQDNEFSLLKYDVRTEHTIASDQVRYVTQDNSGILWIGTFNGISKWNSAHTKFDHYKVHENKEISLIGPNITYFSHYKDNQAFIATTDGVSLLDMQSNTFEHLTHDPENENSLRQNQVMSLLTYSEEEVWFGYRAVGLSRYNPKTGQIWHYNVDKEDPTALQKGGVTSIIKDHNNDVWLSTFGGGISKYNRETDDFVTYTNDPEDATSINSDKVVSLMESRDGLLWLGTWNKGISIFNPDTKVSFNFQVGNNASEKSNSESVWTIFEDSRGNIWFGTQGGGLHLLQEKDFARAKFEYTSFSQANGMPSNVVYGILEDTEGFLWITTNRGLVKMNPITFEMKVFTTAQGLLSNEFNSGSYYKLPNGKFLLGSQTGVTAFHPSDIQANTHIPPTFITRFQILNDFYHPDFLKNDEGKIEITYQDYLIGFEFVGLDFVAPDNNEYRYRLKGFDQEWVDPLDTRRATYTNLPAGEYEFQVIASNSDGMWNEIGDSIKLVVHPAPWLSPWAYAVYASILVLIIALIARYQMKKTDKERKYRETLEEEVSQRTRELQQVNDKLLSASITDQLTGLHNRRYLADVLPQLVASVSKKFNEELKQDLVTSTSGTRLFFLMFDLDGFKPINDTYGHDAGDKVIIQVAELLKEVCRVNDIVIRWGGDEFLIVGQINDVYEVSSLAERVRSSIAKCGFNIGLSQRMHVSSSMGFSVFPFSLFTPDALSWEQVHLLADNALYKSKDAGRNTWTGILQSEHSVPYSIMNTMTSDVEKAILEGNVRVLRHQPEVFKSSQLKV